jgi:hypothetical protein
MRGAWHPFSAALLLLVALRFVCRRCDVEVRGWRRAGTLAFCAVLITTVPVAGWTVADWMATANVQCSVPLVALLLDRAWADATERRLLDRRGRDAAWRFGAAAGIALYPMALGAGAYDPYTLGWSFGPLFVGLLALTLVLLLRRNGFGMVLVGAILAYDLHLLESPNLWDYLVDPVFAAAALVAVARRTRWTSQRRAASATDGTALAGSVR